MLKKDEAEGPIDAEETTPATLQSDPSDNVVITQQALPSPQSPSPPKDPENLFQAAWQYFGGRRFGRGLLVGWFGIIAPLAWFWTTLPEQVKSELIARVRNQESFSRLGGTMPSVDVKKHVRTVDLTKWKPSVGDEAKDVSTFVDSIDMRKVRPDAKYYCMTAGASGTIPTITSDLRKVKIFEASDMSLIQWPQMAKQLIFGVDISNEERNSSFNVVVRTERIGGFKDPKRNFCSIGVWHPTELLEYHVVFPMNKVGRNFKLKRAYFNDRELLEDLDIRKERTKLVENEFVWTISKPIMGYAYQIQFEW